MAANDDAESEEAAARLVRSSNAYLVHLFGAVLILPALFATAYFDDRRGLFGVAAGLFLAGGGAIAGRRTLIRVRGSRTFESLLEDETRTRALRFEARFIGTLLMLLSVVATYFGIFGITGLRF